MGPLYYIMYFYPRPPRGGRLYDNLHTLGAIKFLSTSSARRTTNPRKYGVPSIGISIHVLREEDDLGKFPEHRHYPAFLSTSSARRTTRLLAIFLLTYYYFYPRPPRGGRPSRYQMGDSVRYISIHVLREEDDLLVMQTIDQTGKFLSTSSARRTTAKTERKASAFVQLYNTLHEMKRLKGEKTQNGLKIMQSCTLKPVRRVRGFCESLPFARASVQGA